MDDPDDAVVLLSKADRLRYYPAAYTDDHHFTWRVTTTVGQPIGDGKQDSIDPVEE